MNRVLSLLVLTAALAACGGTPPPATSTPADPPPAADPAPAADPRCTAPQRWFAPACSADTFGATKAGDGHDAAGCYVPCEKPGGTTAERSNPSACAAGFTCAVVMVTPANVGTAEVCGQEAQLCLPAR